MERLSCTTDKYDALYARWLKNPESLVEYANIRPGDLVLDLCGGTGAVAKAVREQGRAEYVTLLDLNPRCTDQAVVQRQGRAENLMAVFPEGQFDVVICRQAIAYLDILETAISVHHALADRGRFVFNGFIAPRWNLSTYKHKGRRFIEASAYLGRRVFHLQAAPRIGADLTRFSWHKPQEIGAVMEHFFALEGPEVKGRSYRFRCTKIAGLYGL